jgi:malate dehydrogenase
MHDVAIVGAGELGGELAHALARRNAARLIRLIDEAGGVAEGKALDILEGAPIEAFTAELSGSTDVTTAAGAAIIVIADRARAGARAVEEGLLLLERITRLAPRAIIVCAGDADRDLVERGVRELHIPRTRLLGSAPEALAGRARALVAVESNASPRDVSVSVLGVPPARIVVSWEHATVAGLALARFVDERARRRVTARLAALWPPGPYALATAATKIIETLTGGSRRLACCFVAPDDSAGVRMRAAALTVRLGPGGIAEVVLPPLSAVEQIAFENAVML